MINNATTKLLGSIVGWSFVPNFATRSLIQLISHFFPKPLNRAQQVRQYRLVYAFVVLSYLLYNFADAMLSVPPSFYELLGVSPDVDEVGLKAAFRTFARRHHPDRVGAAGTAVFVAVRSGYDSLMSPAKRWAYDRFGPDILKCTTCTTESDFLYQGLISSLGFHIASAVTLLCFYAFSGHSNTSFWRCVIYFVLAAGEYTFIFSTTSSMRTLYDGPINLFEYLFPSRVPFQHVKFLHQAFVFLSVALSRVFPVLFPPVPQDPEYGLGLAQVADIFSRVSRLDRQAYDLVSAELSSVMSMTNGVPTPDKETMNLLTAGMERLVLEARLNLRTSSSTATGTPSNGHAGPFPLNRQPSSSFASNLRPVRLRRISTMFDAAASNGPGTLRSRPSFNANAVQGSKTENGHAPEGKHDSSQKPRYAEARFASPEPPRSTMPGEFSRGRSKSW